MKALTDEQWWEIADYASSPVELTEEANDNDKFYVYDREFGYFIVGCGHHQIVMAHLWAFRSGYPTFFDAANALVKYDSHALADKWLEMPGTCFHSSMGRNPTVWRKSNLNFNEKRILGPDFLEVEE